MRISRIEVKNFRNFKHLDIALGQNIVLVGENGAGKSNIIEALRLIFDPSLSDNDRRLTEHDFWDGDDEPPFNGREIKVSIQFTDFADENPPEYLPLSWLSDCLIATIPKRVAQITYLFYEDRKLPADPTIPQPASGPDDYEFKIFPGNQQDKHLNIKGMRNDIPLYHIEALRDIAKDNKVWLRSPLNRLLKLVDLSPEQLKPFADAIKDISERVVQETAPLTLLESEIKTRLNKMAGSLYGTDPKLGLNATTPETLLEALRIFADGTRQRPLDRISLGLQNALYLSLLSLLLEKQQIKRSNKKEPFIPIIALEEPEAHLHPHLQRLIYQDFLHEAENRKQPVVISTHSPHLATAASLKDLVLLKNRGPKGCQATSAYEFVRTLDARASKDLERFLDITKSEMLFSKGTIFVEGDVEVLMMSEFADILGKPLDRFGISVCNVYGAHFGHVLMLAHKFRIPWVVLTDGDKANREPGLKRGIELFKTLRPSLYNRLKRLHDDGHDNLATGHLERLGVFINEWTIEVSLLKLGLVDELKLTFTELGQELGVDLRAGIAHIDAYMLDQTDKNVEKVLASIADPRWGKGRFAQRLTNHIREKASALITGRTSLVPEYIRAGIEFLVAKIEAEQASL